MKMQIITRAALKGALLWLAVIIAAPASAANFSFTGSFFQDDNIQLFKFSVADETTVTIRSWSYAGGSNAAGQTIARGGFDPVITLFDGFGNQYDGSINGAGVNVDPDSSAAFDVLLEVTLIPGS